MYILSNFTCCFCDFFSPPRITLQRRQQGSSLKKKKKSVFFFFFSEIVSFCIALPKYLKVLEKVEEKCLYSALFWLVDCILFRLRLPTLVIR